MMYIRSFTLVFIAAGSCATKRDVRRRKQSAYGSSE